VHLNGNKTYLSRHKILAIRRTCQNLTEFLLIKKITELKSRDEIHRKQYKAVDRVEGFELGSYGIVYTTSIPQQSAVEPRANISLYLRRVIDGSSV